MKPYECCEYPDANIGINANYGDTWTCQVCHTVWVLFNDPKAGAMRSPLAKGWATPVVVEDAWKSEDDKPLPEDPEIKKAFPTRSGRHDLYGEAMRLVGARYSKSGLVALVNWLLHRNERAQTGRCEPPECPSTANLVRDFTCADCGKQLDSHVITHRHSTGACGETYVGPEVKWAVPTGGDKNAETPETEPQAGGPAHDSARQRTETACTCNYRAYHPREPEGHYESCPAAVPTGSGATSLRDAFGKTFHCDCGGTVFRKHENGEDDRYRCNVCGAGWTGANLPSRYDFDPVDHSRHASDCYYRRRGGSCTCAVCYGSTPKRSNDNG